MATHRVKIECKTTVGGAPCMSVDPNPLRVSRGDTVYFFAWGTEATVDFTKVGGPKEKGVTDAHTRTVRDYRDANTGRLSTKVKIKDKAPRDPNTRYGYIINTPDCPNACGAANPPSMICN